MLELTGVASVLRAVSLFYWLLAIGSLALVLWKVKGRWRKTVGAVAVVGLFGLLPAKNVLETQRHLAYTQEAWSHFRRLCQQESGERIYKTYSDVRSVLIVKPLPPATERDLYDQYWYGDPYSDATPWDRRAVHSAGKLVYPDAPVSSESFGRGFEFVETYLPDDSGKEKRLVRISFDSDARDYRTESIAEPVSKLGLAWDDISTPMDRRYWVSASRLRAIDLTTNTVVAERIGYFIESGFGSTAGQRRPWLASKGPNTTCPASHDWSDRWFVLKVFKPTEKSPHGK